MEETFCHFLFLVMEVTELQDVVVATECQQHTPVVADGMLQEEGGQNANG